MQIWVKRPWWNFIQVFCNKLIEKYMLYYIIFALSSFAILKPTQACLITKPSLSYLVKVIFEHIHKIEIDSFTLICSQNLLYLHLLDACKLASCCKKRKSLKSKFAITTGHRGVCCNPCNWDGRYWMPTMVGDP